MLHHSLSHPTTITSFSCEEHSKVCPIVIATTQKAKKGTNFAKQPGKTDGNSPLSPGLNTIQFI
jgi:hypothetical protein